MLDREESADALPRTVAVHVRPFCARHGLAADMALLDYVTDMCDGLRGCAREEVVPLQNRCISVLRCVIGAAERAKAAMSVIQASPTPSTTALRMLGQEASSWRGCGAAVSDALAEQLRLMHLKDIVAEYGVEGFSVGDSAHASLLVSHICAQTHRPRALADALTVSGAYAHLSPRDAAVAFFESLCLAPPTAEEVRAAVAVTVHGPADQSLLMRVVAARCTSVLAHLDACKATVVPTTAAAVCNEVCEFIGVTLDEIESNLGIVPDSGGSLLARMETSLTAACNDGYCENPAAAPVEFDTDDDFDARWMCIVGAACAGALAGAAAAYVLSYGGVSAARGSESGAAALLPTSVPVCVCASAEYADRVRVIRDLHALGVFVGPSSLRGRDGGTSVFLAAYKALTSAAPDGSAGAQRVVTDGRDESEPVAFRLATVLGLPRDRVRGMLAVSAAR